MKPERFDAVKYMEDTAIIDDPAMALAINSSLLAYYGMQAALWEALVLRVKDQVKNRQSEVAIEAKNSGDKITEKGIEALQNSDEEAKQLKDKLNNCIQQELLYNNACRAFVDRGNNARSLSSRDKSEMAMSHGVSYAAQSEEEKQAIKDRLRNVGKR